MFKRILILVLFVSSCFLSFGQRSDTTTGPNTKDINVIRGGTSFISYLQVPVAFTPHTFDSCRMIWYSGGNIYFHDCNGRMQLLSIKDSDLIKSWLSGSGSTGTFDDVLTAGNRSDKTATLFRGDDSLFLSPRTVYISTPVTAIGINPDLITFYDLINGGSISVRGSNMAMAYHQVLQAANGIIALTFQLDDSMQVVRDSLAAISARIASGGGGGAPALEAVLTAGNTTSHSINMYGGGNFLNLVNLTDQTNIQAGMIRFNDLLLGGYVNIQKIGGGLSGYNTQVLQDASGTLSLSNEQPFISQTSVTVIHNIIAYPIVQVVDNTGAVVTPLSITHTNLNQFTVTFSAPTTGTIIYIR